MVDFTLVVLAILVILLLFWLYRATIIVPDGFVVLTERFGTFSRELKSGPHVILWPIESLRYHQWDVSMENAAGHPTRVSFSGVQISVVEAPLDSLPVECISQDNIPLTVNATIIYKISNAHTAVYKMGNVLQYMADSVVRATRLVCQKYNAYDIKDSVLCSEILAALQGGCNDKGITIKDLMIQSVKFDKEIMNAKAKSHAMRYKEEAELAAQQIAHERKMNELKNQMEEEKLAKAKQLQERLATIEEEKVAARSRLEIKRWENEERERHYRTLLKEGLEMETLEKLEIAREMSEALKNFQGSTLSLDPRPFWLHSSDTPPVS